MTEEKTPPEIKPEGQDNGEDKGKSAETIETLSAKLNALEKQTKDQQVFIGKQSTEIGELRKLREDVLKPKEEKVDTAGIDEDISEAAKDFEGQGMTKEDALYNAKLLVNFERKRMGKRVMNETIEIVEEAIDDGKIDRKIFEENQNEVMAEFRERKLTPSPRKNAKIFKKCYEDIVKRKADVLKKSNEKTDEEKRDAIISGAEQPSGGTKETEKTVKEDDEARKRLRAAGSETKKGGEAFF